MNKRVVAVLLAFMLCVCCVNPALAEDEKAELSGGEIIGVMGFRMAGRWYVSEIPEMLDMFTNEINYTYATINGEDYDVEVALRWLFDNPPTAAGNYTLWADVILPDGYYFGEDIPHQISYRVIIYDDPETETKREITALVPPIAGTNKIMIALGNKASLDYHMYVLLNDLGYMPAIAANEGDSVDLPLYKVESDVQLDVAGLYEVRLYYTLSPEDEESYILPEHLSMISVPVCIYDPAYLTIGLVQIKKDSLNFFVSEGVGVHETLNYTFEYIRSSSELTDDELRGQDWTSSDMQGTWILDVPRGLFAVGEHYYVRVKYGGKTSNIIYILDDGQNVIFADRGGDRDGGDGNGTNPPDYDQDPPNGGSDGDGNDGDDGNGNGVDNSGGDGNGYDDDNSGSDGNGYGDDNSGSDGNGYGDNNGGSNTNPTSGNGHSPNNRGGLSDDGNTAEPSVLTDDPLISGNNTNTGGSETEPLAENDPSQDGEDVDRTQTLADTAHDNIANTTDRQIPNTSQNSGNPGKVVSAIKIADEPVKDKPDFKESFGETKDIISGTRLHMMIEEMGYARFSKQGVTVTLSAATLSQLDIKDTDRFSITIERISDTKLRFLVEHNDAPITNLADSVIMLPISPQSENTTISLVDEMDNTYAGSYDSSLSVAIFTVDHAGTFRIVQQTQFEDNAAQINEDLSEVQNIEPQPSSENEQTNIPLAVGAILLPVTSAGGLIWRKWRVRK